MTEQDPGNNPQEPRPPEYPNYPGPDAGQQPPPPPGYGQPPPPPGYGQQPPPGYGAPHGYAPGHGFGSGHVVPYASWWSRVGAYLLDGLMALGVAIIPIIIGAAITASTTTTSGTDIYGNSQVVSGPNPIGPLLIILGYILAIGFQIWNNGVRLGQQGQSIGQKVVGIQVLRDSDGAVLGAGNGFLRLLMMAILGGICFLNYLWPLWDQKKRAWHDMIVSSVVVRK